MRDAQGRAFSGSANCPVTYRLWTTVAFDRSFRNAVYRALGRGGTRTTFCSSLRLLRDASLSFDGSFHNSRHIGNRGVPRTLVERRAILARNSVCVDKVGKSRRMPHTQSLQLLLRVHLRPPRAVSGGGVVPSGAWMLPARLLCGARKRRISLGVSNLF